VQGYEYSIDHVVKKFPERPEPEGVNLRLHERFDFLNVAMTVTQPLYRSKYNVVMVLNFANFIAPRFGCDSHSSNCPCWKMR
jgi:hypothetical protein